MVDILFLNNGSLQGKPVLLVVVHCYCYGLLKKSLSFGIIGCTNSG